MNHKSVAELLKTLEQRLGDPITAKLTDYTLTILVEDSKVASIHVGDVELAEFERALSEVISEMCQVS